MASLYIHIPFCIKKCAYCDFASYPGRGGDMARYAMSVREELAAHSTTYGALPLETIFIGGGTPSLLSPSDLRGILADVSALFRPAPDAEITIEVNPGTVDEAKLSCYRDLGINRLSLGAQAYQPELLSMLGRAHRWEDAERTVLSARRTGFQNINIDLMYALPGQSASDFHETLTAALALHTEHISCYSLIVEEGTPLSVRVARGEWQLPCEDAVLAMQHAAAEHLARGGLRRYEISNYAKPGFECAHNIVYWTRGDYLGVGCAAHSFMQEERFENPSDLDAYLGGARSVNRHHVDLPESREEAVMLATRMTLGFDLNNYRARYKEDFESVHRTAIHRLISLDLIRIDSDRLFLTERGLDVQNAVVSELLFA